MIYPALLLLLVLHQHASAEILVLHKDPAFMVESFRDMASTFGIPLPYEGLQGMFVYAEPIHACEPIKPPPNFTNRFGKWFVVVSRNQCPFEKKVRIAQDAFYEAVIVHNVDSDALEPMSAKNSSGIFIPSVFVSETTGKGLLRYSYNNSGEYFIIINSDMPFNINTHLLLPFAIAVGICFLVMLIFMVVKYVRDRRRQRRDRLSSSALNKIPTNKFQKGDPYETCAICLDDYVDGEKLRILPCSHAYHAKCIDPWLTKARRDCPVCKRKVFVNDEVPYSDTDSDTDSDDRTPLLTGVANGRTVTQGGTFSDLVPSHFFLNQSQAEPANFVTASDRHSINGEHNPDDSDYFHEFSSSTDSGSTDSSSVSSGHMDNGSRTDVIV
ncbi:PREDICTED: E3 ubiquitin-protein ligase RNF13-like [Nicrophorus vespilloides]|uniref:E3 ubiquitin-protein ligase RNF13-like n=1 Tax=Nicrophorus vespilloides TaxID=110193 RepID=A0ABM1MJI8_NICVS|nr:PREDICTED: E3 ubiquitin-protein ligase RNF13-like [Nicrophorus vespilloides]XP_017774738.1 PREDICTED: E3 ubiquitin-protein ligase RNF13-like [Nicrophorus vespilloides]